MQCNEEMILSEDYIDLIVNSAYYDIESMQRGCAIYVNQRIANLYVPKAGNPPISLDYYGYETIPKLYTIMEERENVSESIFAEMTNRQKLTGEGILMGFVDTGIDYRSPAFRNSDGTSRIKYIWDQSISGNTPEGYLYGSEYTKEMIDAALRAPVPEDIVPSQDINGHGTFIASVSCASEESVAGLTGIAPKADIAVVKLKEAKKYLKEFFLISEENTDERPVFQENDIMLALKYLEEKARAEEKVLVVCLAIGSSTGNFGALPFLSSYITYLSEGRNYIVIGTGNEVNKRHHFSGEVVYERPTEIEVRTRGNKTGFWMELWGEAPDIYSIGIISPGGDNIEKIVYKIDETQQFDFVFEKTKVTVDYLLYGSREATPLIIIRMIQPSDGVWKIRLSGEQLLFGNVNVFLPLSEFIQGETYFLESDPNRTLVSPSGVEDGFSIGAYDTRTNSMYYASGRGYPVQQIIKPDVVAMGVKVLGASNKNDGTLRAYSGTGISAAVTAGSIALFLQWAYVLENAPDIGNKIVKNFMRQSATRSDNRQYPNREWGYGALNLDAMFALFRYS